jgi:uncharacterized membrane protein
LTSELIRWAITTLVLSGLFLLFAFWRLPNIFTRGMVRRFGRRIGAEPWNQLQRASLPNAGMDVVAATSPDMFNMFGVYDASREPVRIRCFVPDWDSYWSISLYAWNTENFYVLNDRKAKPGELVLIVVGPRGKHDRKANETVVAAPTARGVIVIRAVLNNPEDAAEVARVRELLHRSRISRYSDREERAPNVVQDQRRPRAASPIEGPTNSA